MPVPKYGKQIIRDDKTNKSWGSERFHNFYLTNQRVEFSISNRPCASYNGKNYYIVNFDGQWQLAESL